MVTLSPGSMTSCPGLSQRLRNPGGGLRTTLTIIQQAQTLVQTGSGYTSPARVMLAKKLAEIMPGALECSYFACTGSEATEAALRLPKIYTGRSEIVSLVRGYHGMTHASLSVTGLGGKFKSTPGSGLPGTIFIPAPYAYRSPFTGAADGDDMGFFRQGVDIINWTSTGAPAAIILEVIMSVGGRGSSVQRNFRSCFWQGS